MHFRAGSSECWRWGRPPRESWEHSPEQGNLGRKTKAWEVLTLTVQASQTPPPLPLPQKLLRPTPHSQQPALSPRPRRFRRLPRACAAFSKGAPPQPLPRARAYPSGSPASLNQSSAPSPPPLFLSPQHLSALSFLPFQLTSPHQPRCPQGPTLAPCRLLSRFLANGLYWMTPQSSTTRGPFLFNMSRSSSAEPVADGRKFKESRSRLNRQLSEARCRYRALQPPRGCPTKASPQPHRLAGVRCAALFSSLLSLPLP